MHWWVVISILGVPATSIGPYDTQPECTQRRVEIFDEGMQKYNSGERYFFLGKEVKPSHVKLECKQK